MIRSDSTKEEHENQPMPAIHQYDFDSTHYAQVFALLLRQSDEKQQAIDWLRQCVEALPSHQCFVDAGAGMGTVTAALQNRFAHTVAIEPNVRFHASIDAACPQAELMPCSIQEALVPAGSADFILCAHVFYDIAATEWSATLEKLMGWLAPGGCLVLVLTHPDAGTMAVRQHFYQQRVDLREWAQGWHKQQAAWCDLTIATVPSHIWAASFAEAYDLTEFMLNWSPGPVLPLRNEVEAYIQARFYQLNSSYQLSCDQTFVQLRRKA
jgi:trans-aconitate methyltransferase